MILKEIPEDFFVKEIFEPSVSSGPFSYFLLRKRNWTTFDAIQRIAQSFHIPLKCVGYGGNKDKRAVTEQYISLYKIGKEQTEHIAISDITLTYFGSGKERISLGDHQGNYFQIVVRDLTTVPSFSSLPRVKNLFDDQRFGTTGKNYLIGRAIVQKKFVDACALLSLPLIQGDPIRTLRAIDRKMLRFYISAYQSHLWNQAAESLESVDSVPLVGFLTKFTPAVATVYDPLLRAESIIPKDFLIPQMPELSNEGAERSLYTPVHNFAATSAPDDLHPGKFKATLRFQLPKGAYATHVVKTVIPP